MAFKLLAFVAAAAFRVYSLGFRAHLIRGLDDPPELGLDLLNRGLAALAAHSLSFGALLNLDRQSISSH